jgi:hypothetical protein
MHCITAFVVVWILMSLNIFFVRRECICYDASACRPLLIPFLCKHCSFMIALRLLVYICSIVETAMVTNRFTLWNSILIAIIFLFSALSAG